MFPSASSSQLCWHLFLVISTKLSTSREVQPGFDSSAFQHPLHFRPHLLRSASFFIIEPLEFRATRPYCSLINRFTAKLWASEKLIWGLQWDSQPKIDIISRKLLYITGKRLLIFNLKLKSSYLAYCNADCVHSSKQIRAASADFDSHFSKRHPRKIWHRAGHESRKSKITHSNPINVVKFKYCFSFSSLIFKKADQYCGELTFSIVFQVNITKQPTTILNMVGQQQSWGTYKKENAHDLVSGFIYARQYLPMGKTKVRVPTGVNPEDHLSSNGHTAPLPRPLSVLSSSLTCDWVGAVLLSTTITYLASFHA